VRKSVQKGKEKVLTESALLEMDDKRANRTTAFEVRYEFASAFGTASYTASYLPFAVHPGALPPVEIDFIPEDPWTFWQQSSAKRKDSKSS